ncbi:hypothetical protein BD779DRAFT_1681089 [Infundibulicybe gibba]|nr:hypothetical protein BD779DRAFT_1681089 [Infundibulicybe gibba]
MKTTFRTELTLLQAKAGSPLDLARIQNESLRLALEEMRSLLSVQATELVKLNQKLERRTAVLSPTQGYSMETYRATAAGGEPTLRPAAIIHDSGLNIGPSADATGVYTAEDSTLRAFVNASPRTPVTPRAKTQLMFGIGDPQLLWPPLLGQKSISWDDVFKLVRQPEVLWDCWKPSKSLDQYTLDELWTCYTLGERVFNDNEIQTGTKPPLQLVEQYFQAAWRRGRTSRERKAWERFREIPEWIASESNSRSVSPNTIISELEQMRVGTGLGNRQKGLNALASDIKNLRFERTKKLQGLKIGDHEGSESDPSPSSPIDCTTPDPASQPDAAQPGPTPASTTNEKKRRAPPIDPRKKTKKQKT